MSNKIILDDKFGKFYASEVHKLIPMGRRPMTKEELAEEKKAGGKRRTIDCGFSDTGLTYIDEKVAEYITQERKAPISTKAIEWGKEYEPQAKMHFEAATGLEIDSDIDIIRTDMLSGLPDGIIHSEACGLEIKCPYVSTNHVKLLKLKCQEHLLLKYPEHYWQIIAYLYLYKLDKWKFCSYDPRVKIPEKKMLILNIEKPPVDVNFLEERLTEARAIYNKILNEEL